MGFRKLEDSRAYQMAVAFKLEVYAIAHESPRAMRDQKFIAQLFDAVSGGESNITEGFERYRSAEVSQFLRYALSSMGEARKRLRDGIHRGYFTKARCAHAFDTGERAIQMTKAWRASLEPFIDRRPSKPRRRAAEGTRPPP